VLKLKAKSQSQKQEFEVNKASYWKTI